MIKNKRIEYIDFIKGICIFIVVWGHTIQNMGDGDEFWLNPVHQVYLFIPHAYLYVGQWFLLQ